MNIRIASFLVACLALVTTTAAQSALAGLDQYPQFRVLSGLPGGGFGVLPNGVPDIQGAFTLATPIGYSLGRGSFAGGIFNTGANNNPFRIDVGKQENLANGTAFGMFGLTCQGFNLSIGGTVLSTRGDSVMNLQLSPPIRGKLGVAVGVQDAFTTGGANGEPLDLTVGGTSRSYYAVATYQPSSATYISLGKGERRFEGVFGSISTAIMPRVRLMVEYDGFNFNTGALINVGHMKNPMAKREMQADFFVGLVRGQYGTAGLTISF